MQKTTQDSSTTKEDNVTYDFPTEDTVRSEPLKLLGLQIFSFDPIYILIKFILGSDEQIKDMLKNKHLRSLLKVVDDARNVEEIMQKAMLEPIFVEFADACLKIVEQGVDNDL